MRITPLDIRKQPFRKVMWGFDPDEVNSFLEMVAGEFEALIKHNNEIATEAKSGSEKLETYQKIEKVLNQTLITAQKATDDARVNAQREADLIIKDSHIRAASFEDESRRRVHDLHNELLILKSQRDSFFSRFKSLLANQLLLLDTLSDDVKSLDSNESKKGVKPPVQETLAEIDAGIGISAPDDSVV